MKANSVFDKFTRFMDKLAKVHHDELKEELDAEKQAKRVPATPPTPPTVPTPKTPETKNRAVEDTNDIWAGVTKTFQENPDYEVPY